jgi:hypothetical protein
MLANAMGSDPPGGFLELGVDDGAGSVKPVVEEHDLVEVIVVEIILGRVVDDQRTHESVGVLAAEVRVVPVGAAGIRDEARREHRARRLRCLRDAVDAVHSIRAALELPMPVHRHRIDGHVVLHGDVDALAFLHSQERTGHFAVDEHALAFESVRGNSPHVTRNVPPT